MPTKEYNSTETGIAIAIVICLVGLVWYLGAFKVFDNAKADLADDDTKRVEQTVDATNETESAATTLVLLSVGDQVSYRGFANGAGYDGEILGIENDFYTIRVDNIKTASPKQFFLPASACSGNISLGTAQSPNSGIGQRIQVPTSCFVN